MTARTIRCAHCGHVDTRSHCPTVPKRSMLEQALDGNTGPCGWIDCPACSWTTRVRDGKVMPPKVTA